MSKKKHWTYLDAATCRCGTMICTACGKPVVTGLYRCHETPEAYLVQHRECSPQDPKWRKLDAEHERHIAQTRTRLAAYEAFRNEWNEGALDEDIEAMQRTLGLR